MKGTFVARSAGTLGLIVAILFVLSSGAWAADPARPRIQSKEIIGKVSQPIVVGDPVSARRQRRLGLVTVGGGCSGTLINQYWVLTADHCVSTNAQVMGSPDAAFNTKRITATWASRTATPTRYVRFWNTRRLDVALIFLGAGDLGKVDRKLVYHNAVDTEMTLRKFGQGICSFAAGSGPTATPAQTNCGYRTAGFTPSSASATRIVLPMNDAGQVGNGGDSGGPDYVTDGDGNLLSIASVQSTCAWTGMVPGRTFSVDGWQWVTGISSCTSAALVNIRDDIHRVMAEVPPLVVAKPLPGDIYVEPDTGVVARPKGSVKDVMVGDTGVKGKGSIDSSVLVASAACKSGFVWRVARSSDLVCVTPEARERTARENAEAVYLIDPDGPYGANTCVSGYVWREAFEGDLVCVTPQVRAQVREENRLAASRRAN